MATATATPTPVVSEDPDGGLELTVHLSEPSGRYQSGEAVLNSANGQTRVTVNVSPPRDEAQPAHVHAGSCDDVGPVVHFLENVVTGYSETLLDVPMNEIADGGHVINLHLSSDRFEVYTACAPIPDWSSR
ncbi:MAG: hypothetical protein ACOC5M_01065, partial [Chloroflexota bacterium]